MQRFGAPFSPSAFSSLGILRSAYFPDADCLRESHQCSLSDRSVFCSPPSNPPRQFSVLDGGPSLLSSALPIDLDPPSFLSRLAGTLLPCFGRSSPSVYKWPLFFRGRAGKRFSISFSLSKGFCLFSRIPRLLFIFFFFPLFLFCQFVQQATFRPTPSCPN